MLLPPHQEKQSSTLSGGPANSAQRASQGDAAPYLVGIMTGPHLLEFGQNIGRRSVARGAAGRPHRRTGARATPPGEFSLSLAARSRWPNSKKSPPRCAWRRASLLVGGHLRPAWTTCQAPILSKTPSFTSTEQGRHRSSQPIAGPERCRWSSRPDRRSRSDPR